MFFLGWGMKTCVHNEERFWRREKAGHGRWKIWCTDCGSFIGYWDESWPKATKKQKKDDLLEKGVGQ